MGYFVKWCKPGAIDHAYEREKNQGLIQRETETACHVQWVSPGNRIQSGK